MILAFSEYLTLYNDHIHTEQCLCLMYSCVLCSVLSAELSLKNAVVWQANDLNTAFQARLIFHNFAKYNHLVIKNVSRFKSMRVQLQCMHMVPKIFVHAHLSLASSAVMWLLQENM
uniref:Uncharacterized protein n=1 Tax=Rhipicephalus microplus TaxID=6941 RepID=A0A6G5AEV5_RHIMP